MKMKHTRRICLSVFLSLAMFFPLSRSVYVQSSLNENEFVYLMQTQTQPPEQIETTINGLEKLSPDLRAQLEAQSPEVMNAILANQRADQPVMVSALIQTGVDVQNYFTRSVLSRDVDGIQWITGDIELKELRKLVSQSGVLGVISTETYQTTEAPGLEDLRFHPSLVLNKEARKLLKQGGPDLLRLRVDQQAAEIKARMLAIEADPKIYLNALDLQATNPIPPNKTLRAIHDVNRALDDGYNGSGVVVGVVDSGVDFANPDLMGTQAMINGGPYAGWPFSYDTISGALYALDPLETLGPDNFWSRVGWTQYVHTLPIENAVCNVSICTASLVLVSDGVSAVFTWPNTSKSGHYFYSVNPDISLAYKAYYRSMNYPEGWLLPPPVIVVDENQSGEYDTVYIDTNYNHSLEPFEGVTRDQPVSGSDVTSDGTWDMSGGMLGWISDGVHHPPGVETLYPSLAKITPPGAGRLLVFINDQDGHGTNCASEIAGKGKITDPDAEGPANPLYAGGEAVGGVGGEVISSMAPSSKIAAFQNGFNLPFEAWTLAALGMDGIKNSGDEVQILSNSWGNSSTIEDGWDSVSRFAQQISYQTAPNIAILVATGNGGPGYGTVTAPGGGSIIDIGASTAYGAVRGFEIVTPEQFLYGDIQPWSNRGPGGLGDIAPDITAVGAWGTGAVPLNRVLGNGQTAYDVFGGTSMSTPVAAGGLALIYQAYKQEFDVWPTADQAREFLFAGAQDLSYDVFTQGAGNLQVARSIDMALGRDLSISPVQWQVGDYHEREYPAFPAITFAGEVNNKVFHITNPTADNVALTVQDQIYQNIGDETFSIAYSNPPPQSQHALPIFLKDMNDFIEQYQPDMIRAQVVFPYSTFDIDDDAYADSWWNVAFYDWTDRDHSGTLWVDKNHDGRVDENEIDIDKVSNVYEFNRFSYSYSQGDTLETSVGGRALEERHDGVFLGLQCLYCGHSTTIQIRVTFYQKRDWPWLDLSLKSDVVAPGEYDSLNATMTIPEDALPGAYEGAIEVDVNGEQITIPVVTHVAAKGGTFHFGGQPILETPYDNSHIFGGYNWRWRYEAGDWRFFYYDIPEGAAGAGKSILVNTHWNSPKTDIDTWAFGPKVNIAATSYQDIYGPQGMQQTGGSEDTYTLSGQFLWKTNTQGTRETVTFPLQEGLGMVALHNVLNGGTQLAESFSGEAFQVSIDPGEVVIPVETDNNALPFLNGSKAVTFTSSGDIDDGIQIYAYGMSAPIALTDQRIVQNTSYNICSSTWFYERYQGGLQINHGGLLEISTTSEDPSLDVDVFLYKDDGDGKWMCGRDSIKASSMNAGSNENIKVKFPEDGTYWILVHGYSVPSKASKFDIKIRSIQGTDLTLQNMPLGPILANRSANFTINYHGPYLVNTSVNLEGLLLVGTPSNPAMLEIPIHARPDILLYPKPALTASPAWVRQSPSRVYLDFQNLGSRAENVTARIDLPNGLAYQPGTSTGPGSPLLYDAIARTLTWSGPVESGEKIQLSFQVTAEPGFQAGKVEIPAQITGQISGQEWRISGIVWLNLFGNLLPLIRR